VGPVVVLTHAAEFVHRDGEDYANLRRNDLAMRRFRGLCEFLATNRKEFEVTTFATSAAAWKAEPATPVPSWRASMLARAVRVIENRLSPRGRGE
jgi:hypothetical protein